MKVLSFLLVVVLMLHMNSCRDQKSRWKQADVYLLDWDSATLMTLNADSIRTLASHKSRYFTHRHWTDASKVVEALDLDALRPVEGTPQEGARLVDTRQEDARLVVDLFDAAGQRTTYYASNFNLCTIDNAQKHPINKSFRERFRTLAEEQAEPTN